MALLKSSKRSYSETITSYCEIQLSLFPHFIVVESFEEKQLSQLNPKTISGIVTPKSVEKLRKGTILIEVDRKSYAENLLKMKEFANIKIKSFPHLSLNSSKGVVRSSELSLCTLDELKSNLQNQAVTDVKRISINRNQETIQTHTYILFGKSSWLLHVDI